MAENGVFISFEGPEGAGKSTQVRALKEHLESLGHEVVLTREPGGTPTGEMIRDILQHDASGEPISPEAEALLFAASRAQHVNFVIKPALQRGAWVICDRFVDSSAAYQGVGRGLGLKEVLQANHMAVARCMPSLTVLLDIDPEVAAARLAARNESEATVADRIERAGSAFHAKVRAAFLEISAMEEARFLVLDGAGASEELSQRIISEVTKRFLS